MFALFEDEIRQSFPQKSIELLTHADHTGQ